VAGGFVGVGVAGPGVGVGVFEGGGVPLYASRPLTTRNGVPRVGCG